MKLRNVMGKDECRLSFFRWVLLSFELKAPNEEPQVTITTTVEHEKDY
jgi:hypothetical protein